MLKEKILLVLHYEYCSAALQNTRTQATQLEAPVCRVQAWHSLVWFFHLFLDTWDDFCVYESQPGVCFASEESGEIYIQRIWSRLPCGENQHPSSFIGVQFFVLQHRICPEDKIRPQTPLPCASMRKVLF